MAWNEIANIRGPQGEAADFDDLEPEVRGRPAFWLWDGTTPWTPPVYAQPGDVVLNTSTKEIHRVEEVA